MTRSSRKELRALNVCINSQFRLQRGTVNVTSNTSDVIVIGGGVEGLSTAMQLATRGQKVIVLERQRLGCGSTSRAAGLLGQLRGTAEHTRMLADGMEIVK